jgi:hypothetical protein
MRGRRWLFAIGAWTMCTAAVSVIGIGKIEAMRRALLQATHRPAAASASPSPSLSPGSPRVLTTPGGSVVASCEFGMVWVEWLRPAIGFRVQDADQGPDVESKVTFKTDGQEVRVVLRCTDDGPHADVTLG